MLDPDHISIGMKGSSGYLDLEYFKSDVYSFGVVLVLKCFVLDLLLETLSRGRK
jgi:hypothetical protein